MRILHLDDPAEAPVGRDGPDADPEEDEGTGRDGPGEDAPDTRGDE